MGCDYGGIISEERLLEMRRKATEARIKANVAEAKYVSGLSTEAERRVRNGSLKLNRDRKLYQSRKYSVELKSDGTIVDYMYSRIHSTFVQDTYDPVSLALDGDGPRINSRVKQKLERILKLETD